MPAWPAALFALIFGLLATVQLARSDEENAIGAGASALVALAVWWLSPVFLVPMGFVCVVLAWKRANSTLGKRQKKRGKITKTTGHTALMAAIAEGVQSTKPPTTKTPEQQNADALVWRARHTNPFRPEGASGLIPIIPTTEKPHDPD